MRDLWDMSTEELHRLSEKGRTLAIRDQAAKILAKKLRGEKMKGKKRRN